MSSFKERMLGGDQSRYDRAIRQIGFDEVGTVLDAGCGYGQWSRALSRCGNTVIAIDIDHEKLDEAVDIHDGASSVKYYKADMRHFHSLPYPGAGSKAGYDGIFSYSAIYWAGSAWKHILSLWFVMLNPGGQLYFTTDSWLYFIKHPKWAAEAIWKGARPMMAIEVLDEMEDIGFEDVITEVDPFYEPGTGVYAIRGRKPA